MTIKDNDKILLAHGSGGRLYHQLVEDVFLPHFQNPMLADLGDSAICPFVGDKLAMTTDSFVVQPLFFPGGNIGELAVCGTVNDLAMSGARPLYLSVGMIIEAGFAVSDLLRIVSAMAEKAAQAGVMIVTGDTKVVGAGQCDGIYINTAGVGVVEPDRDLSKRKMQVGDMIIVSGTLADHGIAVMAARENLALDPPIKSDAAPLNTLAEALLLAAPGIKVMRDPTRGGVATTLNEWAQGSDLGILLNEEAIPVAPEVASACELLGLDPLYVANEGKLLAVVPKEESEAALKALLAHPLGKNAAIIGSMTGEHSGKVYLSTPYGGLRMVDMLTGEQLPRIC